MLTPVILLITSEATRRQEQAGRLRGSGCWVIAVDSAVEALRRQRSDALPALDLVLTDPHVGGEDIAELQRADFACPVLISGANPSWPDLVRWALQSGSEARAAG
ncbi:MAG: hypothetical protein ACI8RZ_002282 [Myxococcota bacterium]|jgi:hypothetical protein